ncbi:MAG: peptide chain release factor N(5)-glutamine methyltransferase [Chitinophagales bacterium]|nr:peptide chain release factor N(5)-glutamine methyltransferase [Chitinophagales bacterium]
MTARSVFNYYKNALQLLYEIGEAETITHWIFEEKLGLTRTGLLLHGNEQISELKANELAAILLRLQKGEPVQYVVGFADFFGLRLKVNSSVLIPRPETEELVKRIINSYREKKILRILDIGTGSGCIAIALKKNIPESTIYAIDISAEALSVAKENARMNEVEIMFHQYDILTGNENCADTKLKKEREFKSLFIDQTGSLRSFNLIVSNPPYVTEDEKISIHRNVLNFEPHLALFVPNNDPLKFYKSIISLAINHLDSSGKIWLEINPMHVELLHKILAENGFNTIETFTDVNGKNRFISAGVSSSAIE